MSVTLSRYHVITDPFFDAIDEQLKRILFSTRTSSVRAIDDLTWNHIINRNFESIPEPILNDLVDIEVLVSETENELKTIIDINNAAAIDEDILFFSVQPTANCQLGCHYCGQEHRNKFMSEEDQQLLVKRARDKLKVGKYREFAITWFGAEPLIGLPVIRSLTPKFKELAKEFNCVYRSKIVTNGLILTDKVSNELTRALDVNVFEITLDGLSEFHDTRRMQKNGQPTFDKIFANVISLAHQTEDIKIIIRCNVDRENHESVTDLLLKLASEGVQKKIQFYVAPIHSWGNDAHSRSLSADEFAELEIRWLSEMYELGFTTGFIPDRNPIVCMAVNPSSELVDAYGSIYNCTEVSYVPAYGTPNEYAIEQLSGKSMPGNRERLGNFNKEVLEGAYPCTTCRMLPVCGGGCPKAWHEGLEPCPSAKRNIEQRLLLSYAVSRIEEQKLSNNTEILLMV